MAFTADGTKAYVTNFTHYDTVTPITVSGNSPGTAFAQAGGPYAVAISPDLPPTAALAAVTGGVVNATINFDASGSTDPTGTIASYTFDFGDGSGLVTQAGATTTHTYAYGSAVGYAATVTAKSSLGAVSTKAVRSVAITGTPWAQVAYVANSGDNTVSEVNAATGTIWAVIPVGSGPFGVAVSPDGSKAYVTNQVSNNVTPITLATNTPGTAIAVGAIPRGVAFSPDGAKVYVTNAGDGTVTPIAVSSNTPGAAITSARPRMRWRSLRWHKGLCCQFGGRSPRLRCCRIRRDWISGRPRNQIGVAFSPQMAQRRTSPTTFRDGNTDHGSDKHARDDDSCSAPALVLLRSTA